MYQYTNNKCLDVHLRTAAFTALRETLFMKRYVTGVL